MNNKVRESKQKFDYQSLPADLFRETPFHNYYQKLKSENKTEANTIYRCFEQRFPLSVNFVLSALSYEIMHEGWPSFIVQAFEPERDDFYSLFIRNDKDDKSALLERKIDNLFMDRTFIRECILSRIAGYDEYTYLDSQYDDIKVLKEIDLDLLADPVQRLRFENCIELVDRLVASQIRSYKENLKFLGCDTDQNDSFHYTILPKEDPLAESIDIRNCIEYCYVMGTESMYFSRSLDQYYDSTRLKIDYFCNPFMKTWMKRSDRAFADFVNEWREINDREYPSPRIKAEIISSYSRVYIDELFSGYLGLRKNLNNEIRISNFINKILTNQINGFFENEEMLDSYGTYKANFINALKYALKISDGPKKLLDILKYTLFIRELDLIIFEIQLTALTELKDDENFMTSTSHFIKSNLENAASPEEVTFENILRIINIGLTNKGSSPVSPNEMFPKEQSTKVESLKYDNYQAETLLHQHGYQVGITKGKSKKERQQILRYVISKKILSKKEVLQTIDRNINNFRFREQYRKAVEDWQDDFRWVQNNF